jgi:ADP-ribose pyrophosphatase
MQPEPEFQDELVTPEILSSEVVFEGKVWDIRAEEFRYNGEGIRREFMDHTGAVAILALDDAGRVLTIKQYRHPIRARDWELPAGLLDIAGEDPLVGAQRELAEEADVVASEWNVLVDFMTSPGGSTEALRIYLARGVADAPEAFDRHDEELDIEKRWVDLDDIVSGVLEGRIQNSILTIGAFAAKELRSRDWSGLRPADAPWERHPRYRP